MDWSEITEEATEATWRIFTSDHKAAQDVMERREIRNEFLNWWFEAEHQQHRGNKVNKKSYW